MNKLSLIFSTALIVLVFRSVQADAGFQAAQALMYAGYEHAKANNCPGVIENWSKLIDEYKHHLTEHKHRQLVDDWIEHCDAQMKLVENEPKRVTRETKTSWGFISHAPDLSKMWPLSLSDGKDSEIVKEITDRLSVPSIKVYNIKGLGDVFAVKSVPGAIPVFEAAPQFEGIIVDSWYMENRVDVTQEEIDDMFKWGRDVPAFIEHGRERRFGLLAHEVAHMLLPHDLRGVFDKGLRNKDIQVENARIKIILENLQDAVSEGKFDLSSDDDWHKFNETAADYVAGGILAYMGVRDNGVEYMMKMRVLAGGEYARGNATHLPAAERKKTIHMGYEARSVE